MESVLRGDNQTGSISRQCWVSVLRGDNQTDST